jgi:hypothetical protein
VIEILCDPADQDAVAGLDRAGLLAALFGRPYVVRVEDRSDMPAARTLDVDAGSGEAA